MVGKQLAMTLIGFAGILCFVPAVIAVEGIVMDLIVCGGQWSKPRLFLRWRNFITTIARNPPKSQQPDDLILGMLILKSNLCVPNARELHEATSTLPLLRNWNSSKKFC